MVQDTEAGSGYPDAERRGQDIGFGVKNTRNYIQGVEKILGSFASVIIWISVTRSRDIFQASRFL